jgi:hypothetical protein
MAGEAHGLPLPLDHQAVTSFVRSREESVVRQTSKRRSEIAFPNER